MDQEFSFYWWIHNYSYFAQNPDEILYSPNFPPGGLNGTSWCLVYHPCKPNIRLKRSYHDVGPDCLPLKLEISSMKAYGSTLSSEECEHEFRKGDERVFETLQMSDWFYARLNTEILSGDVLGLRCRMWMSGECVMMMRQYNAVTRIGIEKISFLHRVENFSSLKLGEKRILQIPSHLEKVFTSTLCLKDSSWNKEEVVVEISSSRTNYKLCTQNFSIINASGNIIESYEDFCRFHVINSFYPLTRQSLLDKREEYLPNDELCLLCKCTFRTGVNHGEIEEIVHDLPVEVLEQRYNIPQSKNHGYAAEKFSSPPSASEDTKLNYSGQRLTNVNFNENTLSTSSTAASPNIYGIYNQVTKKDLHQNKFNAAEKLFTFPSALEDFKTLYNDQFLTDIVLKTGTKTFPAHKNVLYARSSVFKAMLTNDMKEKNTDCIKVEDLENDTVQRLLLFLYSDSLEELQWEFAIQLYYAADKYAIERLKVLCSSFLFENLSTSTASELLLLADTHNDTELKRIVEDFILEHEKEVFGSEEWEKLIETNPLLVIKTMHLKYKREKEGK